MAAPRRIGEKFAIEIEGDTWRIEVPEREPEQKTTLDEELEGVDLSKRSRGACLGSRKFRQPCHEPHTSQPASTLQHHAPPLPQLVTSSAATATPTHVYCTRQKHEVQEGEEPEHEGEMDKGTAAAGRHGLPRCREGLASSHPGPGRVATRNAHRPHGKGAFHCLRPSNIRLHRPCAGSRLLC